MWDCNTSKHRWRFRRRETFIANLVLMNDVRFYVDISNQFRSKLGYLQNYEKKKLFETCFVLDILINRFITFYNMILWNLQPLNGWKGEKTKKRKFEISIRCFNYVIKSKNHHFKKMFYINFILKSLH